jgi:hypothetical protein
MDMVGNAYEWVGDWHKSYPGNSQPFDYTKAYRSVKAFLSGVTSKTCTVPAHSCVRLFSAHQLQMASPLTDANSSRNRQFENEFIGEAESRLLRAILYDTIEADD